MTVKLSHFFVAFIILSSFRVALSIEKGYYTIVAPGSIRPESHFHVSFTLNDFHTPCWFNISFTSFIKHNKLYEFESIEVEPRTTKLVELLAPSFNRTLVNLEVLGNCGTINTNDTSLIYFEPYEYWAFIQTNKAKYKPGEFVQFRVIFIDQLKRPVKTNQNITIQIYDDQYNLVKVFFDVKLVQGVFKNELELSNYPVLGLWKIKVLSKEIYIQKTFEVDRYVLPKFNVKINTKKVLTISDDQIALEISASNFYGEPVKGNLSISISNTDLPWHTWVPTPPPLLRTSQIDGDTTIFINLKNDLQLEEENQDQGPLLAFSAPITPYKFHIEATVVDDSNEEQSWTTTEIQIHSQRYKIELQAPNEFDSDEILNIKVKVNITDFQDNPIQEIKNPIEIIVGCYEKIGRYIHSYTDFDEFRIKYDANKIGKNFSIINVTNKNYTECYLYAEYQRVKSSTERIYKKIKAFSMDVLTENPEEGKELEIKITNPDPFEEFSYEILSRKDIIQSGRVFVRGNQTTYILRLNVTFLMVPKITIYAHHIKNNNFGGQLKDVIIKRALQNSIEIKTVNITSRNTSVNINLTTSEGSYVGLMGLDLSNLQNIDKMDILTEDYVNMKLNSVNSLMSYAIPFYGRTAGVITFSNVFPPGSENGPSGGELPNGLSPKRIRNHFPESWFFKDFESTPAGGVNLMEVTPYPFTTWGITAFSIHPDTGLTFTKTTTNLKVFQKFFLSMDLPSSIKEGEIIEVPIYITNYMNQDTLVNLTFETYSKDLDIVEHLGASFKPKHNISKIISRKKSEKILFFIKSLREGCYNLSVKATSPMANDVIQKTLYVQPEGISYTMSKTYLVHLTEESIQEDEITIDIPENALSGIQQVEVSVVGDIFQPLLRDLQNLADFPYRNGEDNMKLIIANSIVLKYLKALNHSNPSLESKIKRNLALSYQNQLSFKYLDGSFGLFERKITRTGDIWQTIFALWGLKHANDFIYIDSNVMRRGLQYLKSKQQENGCYKSESGIEEDVKLTAFGLMLFLMDEDSNTTYNAVISKGLAYLYNISTSSDNTPITALAAYVLLLGKHEKAGDFLKKSNSRLTRKQEAWTKSDELQLHLKSICDSLMNLFEFQRIPEPSFLNIVRGLIVSKKEESYVSQMILLQAMLPFVEKLFIYRTNLKIRFKDDQNNLGDFRLNDENFKLFQTVELSSNSRKIKLQSRGHGFAMVDVKYKYNLITENQSSSSFYSIKISIERHSNFLTNLLICPKELKNSTQSKFTIMEINLQSGYVFTERDFNDIENQSEDIKSMQFNDSRNKAVVYVANEACVELEVRKTYKVFNSKPGWVIVYGTNDKDQKAIKSFQINES